MSLKDAVLGLAEDMLQEAGEYKTSGVGDPKGFSIVLSAYARTLKAIALAADTPEVRAPQGVLLSPQAQHVAEIEKHRAEFRKGNAPREEIIMGGDMAEVHGGPANPDDLPTVQSVDPAMPIGAKTLLAGEVYVLRVVNGQKVLEWESNITTGG